MQSLSTWILGAAFASVISFAAWRVRSITTSGFIASIIVGTLVVGTGGWWPGIILVTFFATSSLISRWPKRLREDATADANRHWLQVMANGWPLVIGCAAFATTQNQIWLLFGLGGIAAASADTWSSEIGKHSSSQPRLVTNGKVVPTGTSGGVSLVGTCASVGGALVIGLLSGLAFALGGLDGDLTFSRVVASITLAGIVGGLLDSILGATVQERRYCDDCRKTTESNPHRCGSPTRIVGGIPGFNNNGVNSACVLGGAIVGVFSGIL